MRFALTLALAALMAAPQLAEAQRRGRGKGKSEDPDEKRDLLEQTREAPGYMRWYESVTTLHGQVKITRIDISEAPTLKLHLSFLTVGESGILEQIDDQEDITKLQLLMASGDERRPQPLVTLLNGVPEEIAEDTPEEEKPPSAKLETMAEAGVPMDVMVVGAGHSGYKDVEGLESTHKEAFGAVLTKLGDANVNMIWYGPMLYTYRTFEGIEGELSRFDENLRECEVERRRYRVKMGSERGEDEEEPRPPPCGLHSGQGGAMAGALDRMRFRGKHARLFGIDRDGMNSCSEQGYSSTAIRQYDLEELEQRTSDTGAFEEALRTLVRYGRPGSRKAIIILGDGRDGFIDEDLMCRRLFTSSDKFCGKIAGKLRGRKAREAIQACVQGELDKRSTMVQERWRERAVHWLALMRAAGIRVFSVAYSMPREDKSAVSYLHERERLELLSLKTGGTYREVLNPRKIPDAARATVEELLKERVLTIGGVLKSDQKYRISVKATIKVPIRRKDEITHQNRTIRSSEYDFVTPFKGEGFGYWLSEKSKWLKAKVGTVLYWVIIVVAILLLLLILWLLFKMFKALFKKIFGLFAKKGKAAGKKAAKGAK